MLHVEKPKEKKEKRKKGFYLMLSSFYSTSNICLQIFLCEVYAAIDSLEQDSCP